MADYINKHEAYTKLKDLEAAYIYPPVKEAYATVARRIDEIKATDVQPVNQWVSTKDRLPEESDEYLAVVDGTIMEVSYNPKQKGLICGWSTCDADGFKPLPDNAVTHWMPMPEPPTND